MKNDQNDGLPRESPFDLLNDDCCLAIFERLSMKNLCSVSKTCKRFQQLAADVFKRRYQCKVIIIDAIKDNGYLHIGPEEQYVKCFARYIENVTLDGVCTDTIALEKLNAMYKKGASAEISSPIRALRFENGSAELNESHGSTIAGIAKDVERMTFANMKIGGDLNKVMLHLMPNLKRLTLWESLNEPTDDDENIDWMDQAYSKLEHFAWYLDREIPIAKVKRFLQANPNINAFSLCSKSTETIEQLIAEQIRIDQFFFDTPTDIAAAFGALQRLCRAKLVKRLHLKFSDSVRTELDRNLNGLASLAPHIEGLYFEKTDIGQPLTKTIVKCNKLKALQCNISWKGQVDQLAAIKTLEEFFVYWSVNYINFSAYLHALRTFASKPHLKKVFLRNNSRQFADFEFANLHDRRSRLKNAHKLKIFFKTDETKATGKFQFKREFDLVEPVRVETECVDNPLINEHLTSIPLPQYFRDRFDNSDYDSISTGSCSDTDSDDIYRYKERKRDARYMTRKYGRGWDKYF